MHLTTSIFSTLQKSGPDDLIKRSKNHYYFHLDVTFRYHNDNGLVIVVFFSKWFQLQRGPGRFLMDQNCSVLKKYGDILPHIWFLVHVVECVLFLVSLYILVVFMNFTDGTFEIKKLVIVYHNILLFLTF